MVIKSEFGVYSVLENTCVSTPRGVHHREETGTRGAFGMIVTDLSTAAWSDHEAQLIFGHLLERLSFPVVLIMIDAYLNQDQRDTLAAHLTD